ncbi:MAG: restriction endonuclease [Nitrospirota bacterium]|nr:restriction endonuclease [Nitrospirota bacterium]
MAKGPQFTRHFIPLIASLREMGGSASSYEATDAVIERENIPEKELEKTNKNGQSNVRNAIAWARLYLVYSGHIDSSARGVWRLTEKGLQEDLSKLSPVELFKSVQRSRKTEKSSELASKATTEVEVEEKILESEETQLLPVLKTLSPEGFERLCQRLLREHGFQNVKVTGRSGDGGIDGEGILEINALLSFKVIFQCKRYQGSVGSGMIRDFRGAMIGRADKGIFLTTGSFSMDAKKEAVRDGANPIELVDGEKLVRMFERLELGLKPRTIYEVDLEFFKEYK